MTAVEITLIIVGIIFLLVSFLVQEKLSPKDIESITSLSENELKIIAEKQLKNANDQIEDAITDTVEEKKETTKRELEKETNEKIMAIDEYSNTVLESMNKTHNEILFLYSMLNDKHTELTDLAAQLQQFSEQLKTRKTRRLRIFHLRRKMCRKRWMLQNRSMRMQRFALRLKHRRPYRTRTRLIIMREYLRYINRVCLMLKLHGNWGLDWARLSL